MKELSSKHEGNMKVRVVNNVYESMEGLLMWAWSKKTLVVISKEHECENGRLMTTWKNLCHRNVTNYHLNWSCGVEKGNIYFVKL